MSSTFSFFIFRFLGPNKKVFVSALANWIGWSSVSDFRLPLKEPERYNPNLF